MDIHSDVIQAKDIIPVTTEAYSYIRDCDNRTMTTFMCDIGNDLLYIKGLMTYSHICHKSNEVIKDFREQQEFKYVDVQEIIDYQPQFKNMYPCKDNLKGKLSWIYAEVSFGHYMNF